jgi:hypothetical protein
MTGTLKDLINEVEDLGLKPGTPVFDRELRKLKVIKCRELRGLDECAPSCPANDECETYQSYRRDIRYAP